MEPRLRQDTAETAPFPPLSSWSSQENSTPGLSPNNHGLFGQGAFLLRKTEISVESTPAESLNDGQSSDRASTHSTIRDEKSGRINFRSFKNRQSDDQSSIHSNVWRSSEDLAQSIDPLPLGTTVSIQANQPVKAHQQKLREMKGLEQAASIKRWAGEGKRAEAWGKLNRDPELWDHTGDTLVYFGYQRPQASFRIKASLLEDTKSDFLVSKLQEGFQRSVKLPPSRGNPTALRGGMKSLSLITRGRRELPTLFENGIPISETPIRHEIHFPAPDNASRVEILRHHITTRNLFAFLLDKPLIGLTYYQSLSDLHERLILYMPEDVDCAGLAIRYLINNKLHNVSNDPAAAAGLLAWIEGNNVRWEAGWREAFVHCIGMYHDLRQLPEVRDISHTSRALLERSYLELQARIEACQSRLATFNFDDIWLSSASSSTLSRRSFDRLRYFLRQYHERVYKGWPPGAARGSSDHWLTRDIVRRLQRDFGSLYDYYVDRCRCWNKAAELEARERNYNAEDSDENCPLTKLFLRFDNRHKYPHIPYPYPLLPASATDLFEGKPLKQSMFSTKAKTLEKRTLHACAEASNSLLVGPETATNGLVEAFLRFEKTDLISEANPREVRQGRWVLLYGILQVLATMSVDTPGLWFKDVPYFLNPRLKTPPWLVEADKVLEEANPTLSHCWTVSKTWKPASWAP